MAPAPKPRRFRFADDLLRHRPVHVVWELTLACNLRCQHCGSRAGVARRDELSTAECLDVVRQLADLGTREISLIGGEAYLRRDWLTIVRAIADAGMHCGLQPGGRALTEGAIRQAIAAGLPTIVEAGAEFRQVQLTGPMGNAADDGDMLLPPGGVVETSAGLADLFEQGR